MLGAPNGVTFPGTFPDGPLTRPSQMASPQPTAEIAAGGGSGNLHSVGLTPMLNPHSPIFALVVLALLVLALKTRIRVTAGGSARI